MMAKWYRDNVDKVARNVAQYRAENPGFDAAKQAKRRARTLVATPAWADEAAIKQIYAQAAEVSRATGIIHHVDHVVPLQSRVVCGLHVQNNLRVIPAFENLSKSNKFEAAA